MSGRGNDGREGQEQRGSRRPAPTRGHLAPTGGHPNVRPVSGSFGQPGGPSRQFTPIAPHPGQASRQTTPQLDVPGYAQATQSSRQRSPSSAPSSGPRVPQKSELTIEQRYNELFLDNVRKTVMDHYDKHDKKIFFDWQAYDIWISGDGGPMPSPDDMAALEARIKFFLDIEARKTAMVLMNPIGACRIVTQAEPRILTNSEMMRALRDYVKFVFRQAKHDFLYEDFYAWIHDLIQEFPSKMAANLSTPGGRKDLSLFLISKIDETSFAKVFRFVYKYIDYQKTFRNRESKLPDGTCSPYFFLCQIIASMGAMLRDLASKEMSLNKGKKFRDRKTKDDWIKDSTFRATIDRMYFQMGANRQFEGLEIHHFTWKPVEYSEDPHGKGKKSNKGPSKRKSDADLMNQYLMLPDDFQGPTAPKSPRTSGGTHAGRTPDPFPDIDPNIMGMAGDVFSLPVRSNPSSRHSSEQPLSFVGPSSQQPFTGHASRQSSQQPMHSRGSSGSGHASGPEGVSSRPGSRQSSGSGSAHLPRSGSGQLAQSGSGSLSAYHYPPPPESNPQQTYDTPPQVEPLRRSSRTSGRGSGSGPGPGTASGMGSGPGPSTRSKSGGRGGTQGSPPSRGGSGGGRGRGGGRGGRGGRGAGAVSRRADFRYLNVDGAAEDANSMIENATPTDSNHDGPGSDGEFIHGDDDDEDPFGPVMAAAEDLSRYVGRYF